MGSIRRRVRILSKGCLLTVVFMYLMLLISYDVVPSRWWRWTLGDDVIALERLPSAPITTQPDVRGRRRLGNVLFMYASLFGIARTTNMTAFLPCSHSLRRYFNIKMPCLIKQPINMSPFYEMKAAHYDTRTARLKYRPTVLVGFYQSWKYFGGVKEDLRKDLVFRNYILREARWHIDKAEKQTLYKTLDHVKIGIHVRRGDMSSNAEIKSLGYKTADGEYVNDAMELFRRKFKGKRILFIVCSDDLKWSEVHIQSQNVAFVNSHDGVVDLAVLSLCDHVIMTVGTFGWWGGWLAGGHVVYYRNFARPRSPLYNAFSSADHFPPDWIGL